MDVIVDVAKGKGDGVSVALASVVCIGVASRPWTVGIMVKAGAVVGTAAVRVAEAVLVGLGGFVLVGVGRAGRLVAVASGTAPAGVVCAGCSGAVGAVTTGPQISLNVRNAGALPSLHAQPSTSPSCTL